MHISHLPRLKTLRQNDVWAEAWGINLLTSPVEQIAASSIDASALHSLSLRWSCQRSITSSIPHSVVVLDLTIHLHALSNDWDITTALLSFLTPATSLKYFYLGLHLDTERTTFPQGEIETIVFPSIATFVLKDHCDHHPSKEALTRFLRSCCFPNIAELAVFHSCLPGPELVETPNVDQRNIYDFILDALFEGLPSYPHLRKVELHFSSTPLGISDHFNYPLMKKTPNIEHLTISTDTIFEDFALRLPPLRSLHLNGRLLGVEWLVGYFTLLGHRSQFEALHINCHNYDPSFYRDITDEQELVATTLRDRLLVLCPEVFINEAKAQMSASLHSFVCIDIADRAVYGRSDIKWER